MRGASFDRLIPRCTEIGSLAHNLSMLATRGARFLLKIKESCLAPSLRLVPSRNLFP